MTAVLEPMTRRTPTDVFRSHEVALATTPYRLAEAWRDRSPRVHRDGAVPIIIVVAIIVLLALATSIVAAAIILCAQQGGVLESVIKIWDGYVKIACRRI